VATFAESPNAVPNFIFPFSPPGYDSGTNVNQFQYLMYRPLYWFGNGNQPTLNTALSLANYPTFSNGDTTVTVTLKHYQWSNGETVTAQDVVFWMNLMKVEPTQHGGYIASSIPNDVASIATPNSSTVVFNLKGPVNETWFTYNALSQITPMPMAWGTAGPNSSASGGDCATSDWNSVAVAGVGAAVTPVNTIATDCVAVISYLESQAADNLTNTSAMNNVVSTYATNPLWQIVDGPWHLTSLDTTGKAVFEPNPTYSGPVKPTLAQFVELPFASNADEFSALAANQVSVGYLPAADITAPALSPTLPGPNNPMLASNYNSYSINTWGVNYVPYDFRSNGDGGFAGQIFLQSYFRQAMQLLIDQPTIINNVYDGYALASYGPVPPGANDPFSNGFEQANPYPYNPTQAITLLQDNGWTINRGGTDVCADATLCGVPVGTALSFNIQYNKNNPNAGAVLAAEVASWSSAGINVGTTPSTLSAVLNLNSGCTGSTCPWDFGDWGGGWVYSPDIYPTGEYLFQSDATQPSGFNLGWFSSAALDGLITATNLTNANLDAFANSAATLLPVIWEPLATSIVEVQNTLQGVTPITPLLSLNPEDWSFSSAPTASSSISGTVTDATTHAGLPGICVNAFSSGAAGSLSSPGTTTAADGTYTISDLSTGSYNVQFSTGCGNSNNYLTQWFNAQTSQSSATPVTVSTGTSSPVNASLARSGGISGTVTFAQSGVAQMCVNAYPPGSTTPSGSTGLTDNSGVYAISGLIPGSYVVSVDPVCGGYGSTSTYSYLTHVSPVAVSSGATTASVDFSLVSDLVVPPAPPTTGVLAANFGTPTSAMTTSTGVTSITQTELGSSATVSIRSGALPSGTTASVYPVANPAELAHSLPAYQSYVAAFAVTWRASDGTTPSASAPITMTITDPNIVAGDTVYKLTSAGLVADGTATFSGSVTVTFTSDPTFVVAHSSLVAQLPLTVTSLAGHVGTSLTLSTSGGSGSGQVTYVVSNGTAATCVVAQGVLTVSRAGTCIVTATKSSDATYLADSSAPTTVSFKAIVKSKPAPVTVLFTPGSSALSNGAKRSLQVLAGKLTVGASLTVTGFAKSNSSLARRRASAVATFLSGRVKIHASLRSVTSTSSNKVTVVTTAQ
jgi:peptide/nickel transport system substrate-binding protein